MTYLEDERLAREATSDAVCETGVGIARCPECDAQVIVRVPETAIEITSRGICRCLCGLVWEVELAA